MITRIIVTWVAVALTVFGLSKILPGFTVDSLVTSFIVAVTLGFANLLIRPILFILTLPITLITFGLFSFILNALMLALVAYVVPGFVVAGFIPALLASIIISAVGAVVHTLLD